LRPLARGSLSLPSLRFYLFIRPLLFCNYFLNNIITDNDIADQLLSTVDTTKSPPDDGGPDVDARSQQQSDDPRDVVPQQQKQHLSEDMSGIGIDLQVFHDSAQGGRDHMEDVVSVKIPSDADSAHQGFAFFAVFDGHGGADAAHFADEHLLDQITRRAEFWSEDDSLVVQGIKDGFVSTHRMMAKAVGRNIVIKYLDFT